MMKKSWMTLLIVFAACQPAADEAPADEAAAAPAAEAAAEPVRFEGGTALGEALTLETITPVSDIVSRPEEFLGKRVLVKGVVTGVCQEQGCWMDIIGTSGADTIQIKVDDGVIVFPKDAVGKQVIAEGNVEKLEMTKEEALEAAKHKAEEQGTKFDPASVTGPVTKYRIRGLGVQLSPA